MAEATLSGKVAHHLWLEFGNRSWDRKGNFGARSISRHQLSLSALIRGSTKGQREPEDSVEADMSSVDGPAKLVDSAVGSFGRLDIVVNNAALAVNAPLEEVTLDHWDKLVNLNCRGVFLLTQAALKHIVHGSGRIVNIVSVSSRAAPPMHTIYVGTKGMVDSFTRCRAKELPPKYGCTVNAVSPGPTMTERFLAAGEEAMKILQPTIDATPAGKRMADPK